MGAGTAFQMFEFDYFTTLNSLCSIDSYQLSSDQTSVVPIPDLTLVEVPSSGGYQVRRQITDGNVYDYTFYIHVLPTDNDGTGTTAIFGPFQIQKFPYCTVGSSIDVVPVTTYPNLIYDLGEGSGFTDVSDQNFMSVIEPSCLLQSCQIMDNSCTSPTLNSDIQFDADFKFQVNLNAANLFVETVCVSCIYTDTTINFANVVKVTNTFTVTLTCEIFYPPVLPDSKVIAIIDSSDTTFIAFSLGVDYTTSSSIACPITGLFHADSESSSLSKPDPFVAVSSTYVAPDFMSEINLIPGTYSFFLRSVASSATGDIESSSAELTIEIFCDESIIVEGLFESLQTGLIQDGENYFHRLILPKYFSNNVAVCDILSYTVSSDPVTTISIPNLTLDSLTNASYIYIDKKFNNSFSDTELYLHVETSGGDHSAKVSSP